MRFFTLMLSLSTHIFRMSMSISHMSTHILRMSKCYLLPKHNT